MLLLTAVLFQFTIISADKVCGYDLNTKVTVKTAKGKKLSFKVGIADTPEKQEKGLMFCEKLAEKTGLLFVFSNDRVHYFWMKNTKITLAIIYIDKDGKIVSIRKGEPLSKELLSSIFPVRYALEINWKEASEISPGDKVIFQ